THLDNSLSLHDALPIFIVHAVTQCRAGYDNRAFGDLIQEVDLAHKQTAPPPAQRKTEKYGRIDGQQTRTAKTPHRPQPKNNRPRSEEHTSELQSRENLV